MHSMWSDVLQLSALWVTAAVGMVVCLLEAAADRTRPRPFLGWFTVLGLGVALAIVTIQFLQGGATLHHPAFRGILTLDRLALLGSGIALVAAILTVLSSIDHLPEQGCEWGEYYGLVAFAVSGMMAMMMATELITLFIALEIMSLSIYVLAGFKRQSRFAVEAALKYFLLGAFASAFLLYGIAFGFGLTGSTRLDALAQFFATHQVGLLAVAMLATFIVAFGFKVAAVPFHMWTPDAYEGAPAPVTGLMATGVKTAAFVALARVFLRVFGGHHWQGLAVDWPTVLWWVAVLTMTLGNTVALVQRNVKRMLAYSSIAHAGYLLIGVLAAQAGGHVGPLVFYLFVYSLATAGAFAVVSKLGKDRVEDITYMHLAGLGYRSPVAAVAMVIFMASLAGMPPAGGFLGKYVVFKEALDANTARFLPLVLIAVVNSLVSVYYYLKVVVYMYMREDPPPGGLIRSAPMAAAYVLAALAVLYVGVLPSKALSWSAQAHVERPPVVAASTAAEAIAQARAPRVDAVSLPSAH